MDKFKRVLNRVENLVINLCVIFLILIISTIMYQVVARRLNIATSGTEELARYCYVLFVFMIWPIAAKRGEDLRITVLFDLLSARVRTVIMGVFQIFMSVYSVVCIYSLYLNIQNAVKSGLVLPSNTWVKTWWIYAIVLFAMVLTFVANLIRAFFLFTKQETVMTQDEANEAELAAEEMKIAAMLEKQQKGERI